MSRASNRCERARVVACVLVAVGCAGHGRGPEFPTSTAFPELPARPPSFADDAGEIWLPPGIPAGSGLIEAQAPLDPENAREVVDRFFAAVLGELSEQLFPLFAAEAAVISEGNRQPAQSLWRARLAQLDYRTLSGRLVAPPHSLRSYTFAAVERARAAGVPPPSRADEVVVVVSLGLSWTGRTRLFGDQLAFRLRPRPGEARFEIAEIVEDFRLP